MEKHPDPETLSDFSRLALENRRLRRTAWHLSQCRSCRRALARLSPEGLSVLGRMLSRAGLETGSGELSVTGPTSYGSIFARVREKVAERAGGLEEDRRLAGERVEILLNTPEPERNALLLARADLRSRAVVEHLLERARVPDEEAGSLSRLAISVIRAMLDPGDPVDNALLADLEAEAWGLIGNAERIRSDLRAADQALARARDLLAVGTGDPLAWAQVAAYESSVRRAQRRFGDALRLLDRTITIFRRAGDRQGEARSRVNRGVTLSFQGDHSAAIEELEAARALADFEIDRRLELTIEQNLLYCLMDSKRFDEALRLLPRVRRLSRRIDRPLDRLELDWLEGQLQADLGRRAEAEKLLESARRGYIRLGIGYSAALVSLDLACLLLEDGRDSEVRHLAVESLPIFLSRDVPSEAAAALALFRQAALAERATVEMVREVTDLLRPERDRDRR
ncbi:MAG: tetratricopeptide repeat protein [Acidobacteriota bacterium]